RAILRTLLGRYLDAAPHAVRFTFGPFGKPSLDPSDNQKRIAFNVSHSGDYSLLAFGMAAEVGVDVERIRPKENLADLARDVLSPAEYSNFLTLQDSNRQKAFFQAWTRKEAMVKATGEGLSVPLDRVDLAAVAGWSIRDIDVHHDYAAAVAVHRQ